MKQLGNHLNLHYLNMRKSFLVFWAVVLAIFILNLALAVIFSADQVQIGFIYEARIGDEVYRASSFVISALMAVIIYVIVAAFGVLPETYGLTVGLGSTRRHYYLGLVALYLLLAAAMAVVLGLLFGMETVIYNIYEIEQVNFVASFQGGGNIISHLVFYFNLLAVTGALFSLIALLYYRAGNLLWLYLMVAAFALLIVPPLRRWVWDFILFFGQERAMPLFALKMLGLAAVLFLLGWPAVRRAAVKTPAG